MSDRGEFTREEIHSQPFAWQKTLEMVEAQAADLDAFIRQGRFTMVLFTGCGSTYYLALAAAALFQDLVGLPARGLPASEIWLYPRSAYVSEGRALLVAVSRSGETSETLQACRAFRASGGGQILTLSCYPEARLAQLGDLNLLYPAGQERSVAQTRAFSSLYLAVAALAAHLNGDAGLLSQMAHLPPACERLLVDYASLARRLGGDASLERFYLLGSGPRYGLACELSLKMKEMSLSHSEPFHFFEFRHGPKSMVDASTLIVGLVSESHGGAEAQVLREMQALGAKVLPIGESDTEVAFHSGAEEAARGALYLPFGQLLAFERALSRGLDPDHPHNLDSVVFLEG